MKIDNKEPIELVLQKNSRLLQKRKYEFRHAWQQLIHDRGPYIAFLTLKFQRDYSDTVSISSAQKYFATLNRLAFGRRWFKKGLCFSGVVVAEQNKKYAPVAGNLHFHALLQPNLFIEDRNDLDRLTDIAWTGARRLLDSKGRQMCAEPNGLDMALESGIELPVNRSTEGIQVKPVRNEGKLVSYLTKEIDDVFSESGDQIFFLGLHGLEGGCLDQWRKRSY